MDGKKHREHGYDEDLRQKEQDVEISKEIGSEEASPLTKEKAREMKADLWKF